MCFRIPQQSGSVSSTVLSSLWFWVLSDPPPEEDVDAVQATNIIDEHRVCGFTCHRVSQYPEYQSEPLVYSGPGVMDKFYDHFMRESEVISGILANDQDMSALIAIQQRDYQDATTCAECGGAFSKRNHKVRHHDHVTGQYLFPACNSCNLTLKMPNRKKEGHARSETKQKGKDWQGLYKKLFSSGGLP